MKNKINHFILGLAATTATFQGYAQQVKLPALSPQKPVEIYSTTVRSPQDVEVSMPIRVNHFKGSSSEFSIQWDPGVLTFMNVERFGLKGLTEAAFATSQVKAGTLHFSWKNPSGQVQTLSDGSIVFAICFKLKGASGQSSPLSLSGQSLPIGRITIGEAGPTGLEELAKGFTVEQSSPNPFTKEATIGYRIPQDGLVTIQITDQNGRLLKRWEENKTKGNQALIWNGTDDAGNTAQARIYFCTLKYKGLSETRKILKAN